VDFACVAHNRYFPMKTKFALATLAISLLSFSPLQIRANTIALSFTSHAGEGTAADSTLGWSFSLSTDILVTDLGVWDGPNSQAFGPPGDGLRSDQLITIWTSTGTFVTSATVPAGGGTLASDFRYVSIAQTSLTAGNYVIGTYYTPGNLDRNAAISSTITTAPEVTYGEGRIGSGNAFPSSTFAGGGVWGPNFQFVEARNGVPEAGSSCVLLAIAITGMVGFRFMRQRGPRRSDRVC
jgi:hypothetical protein